MATEPSGVNVYSPKISDQALARKFVSQGGTGYVAISIGATPVDADQATLELNVWARDTLVEPPPPANPYGTQMMTVTEPDIIHDEVGKYHYNIGPNLTNNRGLLTAIWTYAVNGTEFSFTDHLQVLEPMPVYETLSDQEKSVVEQVTWMFADLYDSTEGGPHLIEEFQTHWDYERIAQLQRIAVQRMNFIGNYGNPPTTWGVGSSSSSSSSSSAIEVTRADGSTFIQYSSASSSGSVGVPEAFAGLAVLGTYVEVLRHLRDSYTELPNRPNMDVTYTDRRDYFSRWGATLQQEEASWRQSVKDAKRSLLSMSRGSLLVAGGIYGGSALGIFQAGTYAAQVRSWRFYPAAPAIAWGATAH
jgi:hypothetical protein